tara:strand:- start:955 stop:1302 length:348 start_codon:yes stop_codon:yes gene_type:complete
MTSNNPSEPSDAHDPGHMKSLFKALSLYGVVTTKIPTPYKSPDDIVAGVQKLGDWYSAMESTHPEKIAIARLAHALSEISDQLFGQIMFSFTTVVDRVGSDENEQKLSEETDYES